MLASIYGENSAPRNKDDRYEQLWHRLAPQYDAAGKLIEPNSGLTQRKNEIIELWQLFRRKQPQVIVEVGVSQGGTFASWCQLANKGATLIGIDRCLDDCRPRPGDPIHPKIYRGPLYRSSQGGGIKHLGRPGQRIVGINGWSYEPTVRVDLLHELNERKIDFLFHDASHKSEMFEADFEWMWPLIADGGIFASHDIMPSSHPDCDKSVAWKKIKHTAGQSACYEYRGAADQDSFGIGVLIK